MGRHNTIAGRMEKSADARGRLFTKLAREIMVTARMGIDINSNAALRVAVNKAKDSSMPKDTIERAIKKGSGELKGIAYEEILYEGYGPGASAFIAEILTDNRNRSYCDIRQIFLKNGGNIASAGAVSWMFKQCGVLLCNLHEFSADNIMEKAIDAGALDVFVQDDQSIIYTDINDFFKVRESLLTQGLRFEKASLEFIPNDIVNLEPTHLAQALSLLEKLENHSDVQNVYCNFSY